ncbi:MAG: hypothetical protein PHT07_02705 [Paludibacter sp.]|nr:hypothetical protein [Paludibacter sp.]
MKMNTQPSANRLRKMFYSLLILISVSLSMFSQNVGINATGAQPNPSAGLDVDFMNMGLLIPRVALTGTTSAAPLTAKVAGMIVYNTATVADVTPGFYYNDGANWIAGYPGGSTIGDMLYWNGTAWVKIPVGTSGQYLQVSSSNIPVWGGGAINSSLSTTAASAITAITATSGGNITNDGGSPVLARGVCWSTTISPTIANSKTTDGTGMGIYVSSLTGLLSGTTYHVRAYSMNSTVINYGNEITFTTLASAPTVAATTAASLITSNTANTGGNVTADGGSPILERGVCYATTSSPTILNSKVIDSNPGVGSYVSNLSGLTGGTLYYVRAYATTSIGTTYGTQISFTTAVAPPSLFTVAATNITGASAVSGASMNWNGAGYSNYQYYGVCYSTVPNAATPTYVNTNSSNFAVNPLINIAPWVTNITGLTSNTTYYIRSFLYVYKAGWSYVYGNELSFTTTSPTAPIVGLPTAPTVISANAANTGGTIVSDGGSAITAKGVCWGLSPSPTLGVGNFTSNGTGTAGFVSNITGLAGSTTYYARTYATNIIGTSYGASDVTFTTWVQAPYALGQILSYGRVGYVAPNGSGFIVSPEIPSQNGWGCNGVNVTGTSSALGTGQTNTAAILACSVGTTTAASVASSYNGGGFNDWYLPSSGDWAQIAQNYYWYGLNGNKMYYTSSQYGTNYNYAAAYFHTGSQAYASGLNRIPNANDLSLMTGILAIRNFVAATLPTVTTASISNIGGGSATGGGNVTNDGGAPVTAYGVCWSTATGPNVSLSTKTVDGTGTGVFASSIAGLNPGTKYYVRAYATNISGTSYGSEVNFTTSVATAPVISTDPISGAGGTVATGGGNVSSDGGAAIIARGICWSTSTAPTIALSTKTSDGTGIGAFVSSLSGLTVGATYYVRAYATNSVGTTYGNEVNFTQPGVGLPTVSTLPITNIYASTAMSGVDVTGDGGSVVTAAGICWSTTTGPDITLPTSTFVGSGIGTFASNLFGLLPTTVYYVRAYATNANGTSYGAELSFTTSAASTPIVVTDPITNLIGALAEVGGTLNSDGGSTLSAVGVCWGNSVDPTITSHLGITNESQYLGSFAPFTYFSNMNNLTIGTTYHVRAYATNASGTSYGTDVSFVATAATLGQNLTGGLIWGYVFSVDATGLHGLIADMWGYGTSDWGCTSTVTGATGTAIGTGMTNTTSILNDITTNSCTSASQMFAFASEISKWNGTDWYLPSKDEMNLLWTNRNADTSGTLDANLNSALVTAPLWSSSEVSATNVWNFDGTSWLNTGLKTAQNIVWPIRSF